MRPHAILALTDFSTSGEHALDRAARVAAQHQARLRLLYASDTPDALFNDPGARLAQRARQLARRHGVAVEALHGSGRLAQDLPRHAAEADLLVVDAARLRSLRGWRHGATVRQVARRHGCAVLVVRQAAAAPYRHVLVGVDLAERSRALVRFAAAFEREAPLQLFHALVHSGERHLRAADVPRETIEAWRHEALRMAHGRLVALSDSFDARRNRRLLVVDRRDAARQITVQQQASQADLVVLGKRPRHPLAELLWQGVAWRCAGLLGCDVLVVPDQRHTPSTGAMPWGGGALPQR